MKTISLLLAFFIVNLLCAVDLDQGYVTISEKLDRFNAFLNDSQMDAELKREKLAQVVEKSMNFEAITQRTLGPHASELTSEQSERFFAAFKTILIRFFVDNLMHYENKNEVMTLSEYAWLPAEEKVQVRVLGREKSGFALNNRDRQRTQTDYFLREKDGEWQITDVTINGVNIAGNYRSQINALMGRSKSAENLIRTFEEIASGT